MMGTSIHMAYPSPNLPRISNTSSGDLVRSSSRNRLKGSLRKHKAIPRYKAKVKPRGRASKSDDASYSLYQKSNLQNAAYTQKKIHANNSAGIFQNVFWWFFQEFAR